MTALWRNATAVLAATVLVLAGCSPAAEPPPSSAAGALAYAGNAGLPDPCGVLPATAVAAVFESAMPDQRAFTVTAERDSVAQTMCNITVNSKFTKDKRFTIDVFAGDQLEAERQARPSGWTSIPGVGDEAYQVHGTTTCGSGRRPPISSVSATPASTSCFCGPPASTCDEKDK